MRPPVSILLVALAASACSAPRHAEPASSAPAPRARQRPGARVRDGATERTHAERLGDLRVQLESARPELVAWAAWRIADERISELWFELRRSSLAWAQREDDSPAAEIARACLLDALIRLDARLAPAELEEWRGRARHRGALLVLASRGEHVSEPLLFELIDEGGDELRAAAGELLLSRRSASAVAGLLWRCRLPLCIDVVETGRPITSPRLRLARGKAPPSLRAEQDMPPFIEYGWESNPRVHDGRTAMATRSPWRRYFYDRTAGPIDPPTEPTRSSGQFAYALLHGLAGLEVPADVLAAPSVLRITYAGGESVRRVVVNARAAAQVRWSALFHALTVAALVDSQSIDAPDPVDLHVRDLRSLDSRESAPLPDFER